MSTIYLNGNMVPLQAAAIAATDRGFLLADGLFETLRADKGQIFYLPEHWQRLRAGADYLEIPFSISCAELATIAHELLQINRLLEQSASLRLTLTRGSGPRGLLPPAKVNPTIMLTAFPIQPRAQASVNAWIVDIRSNEYSPLAKLKSLNNLDNVLAKMAAVKAGAQEAILLNSKGQVAEASAANIFLVTRQGHLTTPRIEDGALPGIMRQVVMRLAEQLGIPCCEHIVNVDDLLTAREIFLTNSLIGIQPVCQLNNRVINQAKTPTITAQLQRCLVAAEPQCPQ